MTGFKTSSLLLRDSHVSLFLTQIRLKRRVSKCFRDEVLREAQTLYVVKNHTQPTGFRCNMSPH